MAYATNPVIFRIEWCQRQRVNARTETEMEGWQAEEEGLRDALLNTNHMSEYQHCPPDVLERYVLGLDDGLALLRAARVERS